MHGVRSLPSLVRGLPADVKRQSLTTQGKPVLDEGTFHQLLAAAFTLQQHSDRLLVKEPKADCAQILSDGAIAENVRSIHVVPLSPETVAHPVPPLEPHPTPTHLARLPYRYRILGRRSSLRDDLFWKAAIVVAVAAVSALLLGATIYRLSPLPGGRALPSAAVQQQLPFRRTKRIVTVPATPQKRIVKPNRLPPTYRSEADIVAEDTLVRYDTHPTTPRLQAPRKP